MQFPGNVPAFFLLYVNNAFCQSSLMFPPHTYLLEKIGIRYRCCRLICQTFEKLKVSILEQIEGAIAYLDTVGTRAETAAYKRMRMVLESAHRSIHNRLHQAGHYHEHTPLTDHPEHHK